MSIHKTEAIVISKRDFRETSLIVNFYTRSFGKLSGILKGARDDPSKFNSSIELFSYQDIVFYRKRNSSLHLVTQCDNRDNFDFLRQNLTKIATASVILELLDTVMPPEDKNEEVFDLLLNCLKELQINYASEKIATIFKIKILSLSGFKPHLDSCVSCGIKILGGCKFSLKDGGLLCQRCSKKDPLGRTIFRGTVASILYIEKNDFRTNLNLGMNPQIKRELETILNAFLHFHLERDFKAQKVLNQMSAVGT